MPTDQPQYVLSHDRGWLDLERVHTWLASSYWSPNVRADIVRHAFANSLSVGAYVIDGGVRTQVGVARVVTDRASFAWLCDVFVAAEHRGRGLARKMTAALLEHPELQTLRRWLLATRDAHDVYAALGFVPLAQPQRWMELRPPPEKWAGPATPGKSP